jgi:hypothetical protein
LVNEFRGRQKKNLQKKKMAPAAVLLTNGSQIRKRKKPKKKGFLITDFYDENKINKFFLFV